MEDIHGALDFVYQILQPDRAIGDNDFHDFQNLCSTFNFLSTSVGKLLQHTELLQEWGSMLNSRNALSSAEFYALYRYSFTDLRLIKYLKKTCCPSEFRRQVAQSCFDSPISKQIPP